MTVPDVYGEGYEQENYKCGDVVGVVAAIRLYRCAEDWRRYRKQDAGCCPTGKSICGRTPEGASLRIWLFPLLGNRMLPRRHCRNFCRWPSKCHRMAVLSRWALSVKVFPAKISSWPPNTEILSSMRGTSWLFFMVPIHGPIHDWGISNCHSRKWPLY